MRRATTVVVRRASRRRRILLAGLWFLVVVVLLLIVARVLLDPVTTALARLALTMLPDYTGSVARVNVDLVPPTITLHEIRLDRRTRAPDDPPYITVSRAHLELVPRRLLGGVLAGSIGIEDLVVNVALSDPEEGPPEPMPDLSAQLAKAFPLQVDRISVTRGEMIVFFPIEEEAPDGEERDPRVLPRRTDVRIRSIEATVENIRTRTVIPGRNLPTVVVARAMVEETGHAALFVTADLLAPSPTIAGQMRLQGFQLGDLNHLLAPTTDLRVTRGVFAMQALFSVWGGTVEGSINSQVMGASVEEAGSGIFDRILALVADTALSFFSDRVPGREAIVARIPVRGKLTDPRAELFPVILSIVRNAFVEGLRAGLGGLPLREADRPESLFSQVERALAPGGGTPPVQPDPAAMPQGDR